MADTRQVFAELKRRNVLRAAVLYAGALWALAQGMAQLGPVFGAPDWATRWFVVAGIMGFPFWLALAWFYRFTPSGLKRESELDPAEPAVPSVARKLDFWIIGILSLAVVLLVTNQLVQRPALPADATAGGAAMPAASIAVLPLANESGDPEQDYFSDGLTEELISDLTQIDSLKVIGKRSSFQFRNSTASPAAISRALGVATLLEGSVRQEGGRVRITVGLINASDGRSLWAHTYDRELKDIFAVQSEIGEAVAAALQLELLGKPLVADDRPPSGNVQAYQLMLQGRAVERRARSAADYRQSIALLRQAVDIDPDYAYAWAVISTTSGILGHALSGEERAQAYAQARVAADKAQALAPDAVATHRARGYIVANLDYDPLAALAEDQRAFALAPHDGTSMAFLASALANVGQLQPAIELFRRAIGSDPLRPDFFANLAVTLLGDGQLAAAEQATRKALLLQPNYPGLYTILSMIDVVRGDLGAARRHARREPDPVNRAWMLAAVAQLGPDRAHADAVLADYIESNGARQPYGIADLYALRKQPSAMFDWLNRAWSQRDPNFTQLLYDPFPLAYKNDPRFAALCKQAGLPLPGQPLPTSEAAREIAGAPEGP